ncbi:MAG: hypothetical protein ACE5K8_07750 [Candidatus Zixiibacteriota bacterium]
MLEASLLDLIQKLWEKVSGQFNEFAGVIGSVRELIERYFGHNGLIAAYIILGVLVVVILSRLTKITIATAKYLIVPAVALAFMGSLLLPYSFFILLPVTATMCSLVLLFKA